MKQKELLKESRRMNTPRTQETSIPMSKMPVVWPGDPFEGADGKKYILLVDPKQNQNRNCYAYAMKWPLSGHRCLGEYIPGFLAGLPFNIEKIEELVRADLKAVKREVYEVVYDIPDVLPYGEGYWVKALYCERTEDFHFAMKDPNSGRWIHKMGWEMPPKVFIRNTIYVSRFEGVPREIEIESDKIVKPRQYEPVSVIGSCVETRDSAGYVAWDEDDFLSYYKPLWVMRIAEP